MNLQKNMKTKYLLLAIAVAVLLMLAFLPQFTSRYTISLIILGFIFAIFAMSLDLLTGYLGHSSLGHAAFFGTAAYVLAIVDTRLGWGFFKSVPFALAFTVAVALIFGLLVARISGVQFLLVNLALAQVVWGVAYRWCSMTGGDNGIVGVSRPVIGSLSFKGPNYYYFVLAVFVISSVLLYLLVNSPFGQTMRGIRQSQSRMRVLGYNVWLHKYITYVISAFFAGVAGILWAYFNNYVGPTDVAIITSSKALLMVLAGGSGTLFGPMIGGFLVVFMENLISARTDRWVIFLGAMYVIVVIFLPGGVFGLVKNIASFAKQLVTKKEVGCPVKREDL
ncbi:MAG: branched-chain amino acid ABC transporter permease [Bacillota bacterium]